MIPTATKNGMVNSKKGEVFLMNLFMIAGLLPFYYIMIGTKETLLSVKLKFFRPTTRFYRQTDGNTYLYGS